MKRVMVLGENSYIGNSFISQASGDFEITKTSSRNKDWDFFQTDCLIFCAGIAHQKAPAELHFQVNCDLAVEAAKRAKEAGVRQFVYLSSAAVLNPVDAYGQSKLKAEKVLENLIGKYLTLTIIRPPMVYGPDCKGNFPKLVRLARITPVFPEIKNRRSMIYVENLCHFMLKIVKNQIPGVFFPQNKKPVCTTELVRLIGEHLGRKIRFAKVLNPLIGGLGWLPVISKVFGDFVYDGTAFEAVDFVDFEESIRRTMAQ